MAYIAPTGTIHLLHNIPLDPTYQHTLRFSDAAHQLAYFTQQSHIKRTFTNQYYTRLNRGIIRVNEVADNLYDCNYLLYQNTGFGNKWFYAFIRSVEYVNNAVTQIEFEIDVMQTWYFDFDLQPCFVERMHNPTDAIGDNIIAEPVEAGEKVYKSFSKVQNTDAMYVIMSYVDTQQQTTIGTTYGGVYSGTTLRAYLPTDITGIQAFIAQYLARPDAIVNMYMCPQWLISEPVIAGGVDIDPDHVMATPFETQLTPAMTGQTPLAGGYIPRNKKCYTHPYTNIEVHSPSGGSLTLRYEFFENGQPWCAIGGSVNLPVELTLIPTRYKGTGNNLSGGCLTETISIKNYPLCSWNVDTYQAWVAQNAIPTLISTGAMLGGIAAASVFNPLAGAMAIPSVINSVAGTLSEGYKAAIAADQKHGQSTGGSAIAMNTQSFWVGVATPNRNQIEIIDSFFDMFGYAQKRIMQPVRKARAIWTYLKTIGCVLDGSVPADDADKICKIHDAGITYWDVESNPNIRVGNYLLAAQNTVIVTP